MLILKPSIRRVETKVEPKSRSTCIGRMVTEEAKQKIVDILTGESTINSISTDLA